MRISSYKLNLLLILSSFLGLAISFGNFYLYHFFIFIVIIVWLYQFKCNSYVFNIEFFKNRYIFSLSIFFSWYLLSLIWTPSHILGLKYIFYIFCGFFLTLNILAVSTNLERLNKIFNLLSVLVFFEIAISLMESFSDFRMPISSYSTISNFFGKDPINLSRTDNIFLYSGINPPTGFRWNTNDLAICMIIIFPFFLCSKKITIKIFGIISITTIIIMSSSRAVFLALILTYFLYLLLIKKQIGTIALIWIVSSVFFLGVIQLSESDNPRINEVANSVEALVLYLSGDIDIGGSIEWRRELVLNGLNAFFKSYGLGLGAGGSVAYQELIGPVAGRFTSMHNFWIEILVEGGIIAFLIIIKLLSNLIIGLFIVSRRTENPKLKYYSQSLLLSVISFIPAAIAASSTIYFLPMWLLFGFSISVILLAKLHLQ